MSALPASSSSSPTGGTGPASSRSTARAESTSAAGQMMPGRDSGYKTRMTAPQEPLPDLDQDVEQGQDEEQNQNQDPEPSTSDGVIATEQELDPEGTEPAAYLDGDPGQ